MTVSARFALPLLHAGQAQKEMSHNEALTLVDALVQPCVEAVGLNAPPSDPSIGLCWIVGSAPEAEWAGQAGALAVWTGGGWRFVGPREGMTAWVVDAELQARYRAGVWEGGVAVVSSLVIDGEQVVGGREAAIEDPDGGAIVDAEARIAIEAMLGALRTHGLIDTD